MKAGAPCRFIRNLLRGRVCWEHLRVWSYACPACETAQRRRR